MRLRAWLIHLREWLRVCVGNLRTGNASTDGSQPSHERLRADGGETRDEDDEDGGTVDDEHGGDEDDEDNEGGGGRDDEDDGDGDDEDNVDDGDEDDEADEDEDGGRDTEVGGEDTENGDGDKESGGEDTADVNRSNVEVTEAGETSPADPKWEKPDPDDLPEFELRADEPVATGSPESEQAGDETSGQSSRSQSGDPTAGMPNAARSPGETRIKEGGAEGYVVAVEICARLPDDVRLPEEAADLVPAAVEAELEQSVQGFAVAEFDNDSPHVDTLSFVERDGEVWFQLRLGVPPGAFSDLDPAEIRTHALQQLEGMF